MSYSLPPGKTWELLAKHHASISRTNLTDMFAADPNRAKRFSIEFGPLYVDYSKNRLNNETITLLAQLARENELHEAIDTLYSGAIVNYSENRAALHTALRGGRENPYVDMELNREIEHEFNRMSILHEQLHSGVLTGYSGRSINTIVNIGIGGSDLGPRLLTTAFGKPDISKPSIHFVTNMDPADIQSTLTQCDPETTLFIISSKSFSTFETRHNFSTARDWLAHAGCPDDSSWQHFAAATANAEAAVHTGIAAERVFRFWDWVGGRYSVWSAAGLAAFLTVGPAHFREFLAGAARVDRHFQDAPVESNIPAMLGLIGCWYINLFDYKSHAIVPYDQHLAYLPDYLCQLVMESNGKSVTLDGQAVEWSTAPVTWGGIGSNAQHSFFQALHQGTQIIPVDFLIGLRNNCNTNDQHAELFASCLAQSRALMTGNDHDTPHRQYPGNRPSNTLIYEELSPEVLGSILAIYEHKTFVQSLLWRINPFDQWGVELGKSIAGELSTVLKSSETGTDEYDGSTRELLRRYRSANN